MAIAYHLIESTLEQHGHQGGGGGGGGGAFFILQKMVTSRSNNKNKSHKTKATLYEWLFWTKKKIGFYSLYFSTYSLKDPADT